VTSSRRPVDPDREESLDGKPVDDSHGLRRGSVGVTLKDVARVADVHPATVSRALDPGKMWLVSRETRAKVQSVAKELGYRGDVVARSLRRGQTTTLGVIVADLGNAFLAPVLRGISGELEKHGFMALISETQDDSARLRASIENLLSRRVDGLIVTTARIGDTPVIESVARDTPVVLAVRSLPGTALPSVTSDDFAGAYMAARHLAELGHELLAELPGPSNVQPFADRSVGFAQAAGALGVSLAPFDERAIHPTPPEGARLMEALLDRPGPRPTAIFAHSDAMAIGAIAAARKMGLSCPRDLSIIGYNDAPLVDHLDPPLTTIRFPGDQIGRFAADLAIALVEEPPPVVASMSFPPELVIRSSTGPPPSRGSSARKRPRRATSKERG
jgi:LacI family transcriptional regulator, galactose operon repressor